MNAFNVNDNDNRIIQNAIDKWIIGYKEPLKKSLATLKEVYFHFMTEEGDFRSGYETYGYSNNQDNMEYISDRWKCAFRVKWIIDGIENGKLL